MVSTDRKDAGASRRFWGRILLCTLALLALSALPALADDCVADRGGVIDGFVDPVAPSQIQIDGNCTIRNFPASNPLTSNISFYTSPGQNNERWLVIFDNVVHTGQMSCNSVLGHKIWFTNTSSTGIHANCQNLLIPVEKINKQNPAGQTTASIGVPFTYTLTIPVLYDPATGAIINSSGSPNDLHSVTVWDDLNATGADLSYVSHDIHWLDDGTPVPHTFSNVGGFLTFDNIPVVTAGRQFVIELTVVLNNTATNVPGVTQFINTAKWDFGRLIDGVFYEPLPGEWGVTAPMTVDAPTLTLTKSGPATMNLGQWGDFTIDVRNTSLSSAWNVSIRDVFPDGATGGMCDLTPNILSARVFAADGVTPIPGKGPLTQGTDYSLSYSAAPNCQLDLTMLTAAGVIGPTERLIVRYQTQLDTDTQNGVALTNVAAAIQWFNDASSNSNRQVYTRPLTNGTVGMLDHEDAHTVNTVISGYFFDKTVANLTSGQNPATTASPGDTLRYTLRFRTTDQALANFRIRDEVDDLNTQPAFVPGTLSLVSYPPGADISGTSSTGGAKGTGLVDIRNLSLPATGEALIQFDITLSPSLNNGTVVSNQATARLSSGTIFAYSDDPNVNGTANPLVLGDEDPTRVTVVSTPAFVVQKVSTDLTGDPNVLLPGETLRYTLTVKNVGNQDAVNVTLRDPVPANTTYVAGSTTLNGAPVADVGGVSPLVSGMLIHSPADPTPGSMPADPSPNPANVATITFDVVVNLSVLNGTVISNQGFVTDSGSGIIDQPSDDPDTPAADDPTLDTVTVSTPDLVVTKSGPSTMNLGQWGDFTIDVHNIALGNAWYASVRDRFPDGATGGMCDRTPNVLSARVFASDGITPVPGKGPLTQGVDYSLSYSAAPSCQLDIRILTAAGMIGGDERLIIRYQTQLDTDTQNGVALTNIAGAVQWFNDGGNVFTRTLTNGTVGTADHEDAHTVTAALSGYFFEKTVADMTSGLNPATTAGPGDTLRYTLLLRTTDQALSTFSIHDELDALNPQPVFAPGTLTLVTYPAGADISGTSSTGGANGTGVVDVGNLSLPAGSQVVIQFDIRLESNLANGTVATNQSTARLSVGTLVALSDDPNVNGAADPLVPGDEDPTRLTIVSAPVFLVQKISTDVTGDPNVLLPGDRLRYTLTVKNVGNLDATNVTLRDSVPANTTYVAGSTILNGALVTDVGGLSPLVNGMLIHSPADPTPGLMPADPSPNPANVATITFDVVVNASVVNGTVISNQGFVTDSGSGIIDQPSDDPATPAANDPTLDVVTVVSGPVFVVQKISTDLTGDPNVLLAGETLRYTLTVKNVGSQDAANVTLRDSVPANTTYVAGSTLLNGASVADVGGLSPLVNGMLIHSPADPTPGQMPADPSTNPANVATITFDVVVSLNVVNGTVISNQGFVTASGGGIIDQPSDDPDTPTANDPTRDVVGNLPLLYAEKRVQLFVDLGSPGIVDPGDVLRYTITVQNSAAVAATGVVLRDTVPANTTYVANSTLLNGLPVADPGAGVPPLASGIDISSSNLTPPLPGPGAGTISPAATAVLQFDLRVNAATPGTPISNQATVNSVESPDLLTDGDGNPATGPEPTVVVVGNSQQLSITKQVTVVGGGAAVPGAQLEYVVRVTNSSLASAISTVITDDLDASQPGQLIYVNGSATMNGSTNGVTFAGSTITADYGAVYGNLAPGEVAVLRFRATLAPGLTLGTTVTNTGVVAWNNPTVTVSASASVAVVIGGVPGFSSLNGSAWHDADFDNVLDSGERALAGWTVELYDNGQLLFSAQTDSAGGYQIIGVAPNDTTGIPYEIRFRAPGAGPNTAMLGLAASPFTNGLQRISDIVVPPGANLQGLNLPIHPNGVIYNSLSRGPVAGASLTLLNAVSASPVPASCLDDTAQQGQVTLVDGYYKFDVNFSDPACPNGGDYLIAVTAPPGTTYIAGYSQIIPPTSDASTAAFSVPACPASSADAIPATALFCEVQPSELPPGASVAPRSAGTTYHVHLTLDDSQSPGSSQIFNNHIPLDPELIGTVAISKTTPLLNVTRGQLVPYVITVNNVAGLALTDVSIVDRFPPGFSFIEGSAFLDGVATPPSVAGNELRWSGLVMAGTQSRTVRLLLAVGAGVSEGEYVNRAQVVNSTTGGAMSGEATATVRVMPDPTFDCTDVTGKVFNDLNRNGVQDAGEDGLPGVRVVTAQGLQATTDQYGRYHITCAVTPNDSRGSNFVLKLDDRTLPTGFRMSTDLMQIRRVTRGKALKFNFGASIYRVVGIDLSDAVFEPGTTEIRVQWQPRLNALLTELRKGPAVLRLSYIADTEDASLVDRRMEAIKRQLTEAWGPAKDSYALTVEPEVFWRLGGPPKRPSVRMPEGK